MDKKIFSFITILLIFALSGCSANKNKTIEDKTSEEIRYLEDQILTVICKFEKGEYQKENEKLDWKQINESVVNINNILDTMILDLSEVDVSNNDLINLRNEIDGLSIAVAGEDEVVMLEKCNAIYKLLPVFLEKCSDDISKINILRLKSNVTSSMIYANLLDWQNSKIEINNSENKYKEMMDDVNYMQEYSYNLNKVYVLLEELKNSIDKEELELCKIKYINFISKI